MSADLDVVAGTAELAAPAPGTDHPHVPVPSPSRWRDVFSQILLSWSGRIGLAFAMVFDPKAAQAMEIIDQKQDEREDEESGDQP